MVGKTVTGKDAQAGANPSLNGIVVGHIPQASI